MNWLKKLFNRTPAVPEPGPWDLYTFPGGARHGQADTKKGALIWTAVQSRTHVEARAINRATGEHIVNGYLVWPQQ
jgi:hypothetical protein